MNKKYEILKTIVGSQAHGLAEPGSDFDYRGVYVVPTSEILSLGYKSKGAHWLEGETEDNTAYEIGHFLQLAVHSNPSVLEVFKAPEVGLVEHDGLKSYHLLGGELQNLFPYVWEPKQAYNAFVGYGLNQRKKMLDNHLGRTNKYATAYLRTLWNLISLLKTGDFSLEVTNLEFKADLLEIRKGEWDIGSIINRANELTEVAKKVLIKAENTQNLDKVNEFLLKVRREFW